MDNLYLQHYGIKGMKWGVRRAEKLRTKNLDTANRYAHLHKLNADSYSKSAKKLRSMSDSDYAKQFDDREYLQSLGGAKKAKAMEIQNYEKLSKNSIQYAKQWMEIHDEIMNTPIDELRSKKDYKRLVNDHLNRD